MAVWKWIVETAATWTAVGIWIRLLFSLAVGMFIGIDRGLKRRGAGIKTHVLVCLGSALVMLPPSPQSISKLPFFLPLPARKTSKTQLFFAPQDFP